jgi:hypothetical protein
MVMRGRESTTRSFRCKKRKRKTTRNYFSCSADINIFIAFSVLPQFFLPLP